MTCTGADPPVAVRDGAAHRRGSVLAHHRHAPEVVREAREERVEIEHGCLHAAHAERRREAPMRTAPDGDRSLRGSPGTSAATPRRARRTSPGTPRLSATTMACSEEPTTIRLVAIRARTSSVSSLGSTHHPEGDRLGTGSPTLVEVRDERHLVERLGRGPCEEVRPQDPKEQDRIAEHVGDIDIPGRGGTVRSEAPGPHGRRDGSNDGGPRRPSGSNPEPQITASSPAWCRTDPTVMSCTRGRATSMIPRRVSIRATTLGPSMSPRLFARMLTRRRSLRRIRRGRRGSQR